MSRLLRTARPAVALLVLFGCAAPGAVLAQADAPPASPSCSVVQQPLLAHPGRERYFSLTCADGPSSVTVDQPAHGVVTQGTTLLYVYRAPDGYTGADHFTLHPAGADGAWPAADVDVTVSDTANTVPACHPGSQGSVRESETRSVPLQSCEDAEGDPIRFEVVTPPAHGTLGTPVSDDSRTRATVSYEAAAGFTGPVTFTYRGVDDFGGRSAEQTATVIVHPPAFNTVPSCVPPLPTPPPPGFSSPVRGPATLTTNCSDPDGDPLTYAIVTPAAHGSLTVDGAYLHYTPDPAFDGTDSYAFAASDDRGGTTAPQTRTIDVVRNAVPVCQDAAVEAARRDSAGDRGTTFRLSCGDDDRDQLEPTIVSGPAHGQLSFDRARQALTYTPDVGFGGSDTATFQVTDAHGGTSVPRTITFTVPGSAGPGAQLQGADRTVAVPHEGPPTAAPGPGTPAPTVAAQAAAVLGGTPRSLDLGFGRATQAFTAAAPRATGPLVVVFCPNGCTVRIGARLVLAGRAAPRANAGTALSLPRRTLRVTGAHPGIVTLRLTRAQRSTVARARRATVVLTLETTLKATSRTVRHTVTLRR
jgi:hypothetical protein